MTGGIVLAAKAGSAISLVLLHLALVVRIERSELRPDRVRGLAWALWLVTRPGLFLLAFVLLGIAPTSDVVAYYLPQGLAALDGRLVYRDFPSSYGPLFPYLLALPLALLKDPRSLVAAAVLVEALAMRAWCWAAAPALATPARERALAQALLLYAASPLAIWNVAISGQNQIWLGACFALAVGWHARGALGRSGLALALGTLAVKAIALVPAPLFLLAAGPGWRRPARFGLALAAVIAAVSLPLGMIGAPVWQPLLAESGQVSSGNIPYLVGLLGLSVVGPFASALLIAVLLLTLLGVSALVVRRAAGQGPLAGVAALCVVLLVFMLVSKKAYADYLVIFWLPLCLLLAVRGLTPGVLLAFGGLSVVATVEPSLWFRWLAQASLPVAYERAAAAPDLASAVKLAVFVASELALVAGYGWLALVCLRVLRPPNVAAGAPICSPG